MEEPVFPRYFWEMGSKYPCLRAASTAPGSQHEFSLHLSVGGLTTRHYGPMVAQKYSLLLNY
jgi:hypothetical protein